MPGLIADVLFDIGKQLIENGDSEAALKFALSGKEPLNAMKRVLASVSTLKLYDGYFFVGWGNKNYKFVCRRNKSYSKVLMNLIGNGVNNLGIDCNNVNFYRAAIDKIIEKKKLISFSAGKKSCATFLNQFLPNFATTLKYVMIPSTKITDTFRDTLNLQSLIVWDYGGRYDFAMFCCKTEKLVVRIPNVGFVPVFPKVFNGNNPHLSSIKQLICTSAMHSFDRFNELIKYFSSLELLQYNTHTWANGLNRSEIRVLDGARKNAGWRRQWSKIATMGQNRWRKIFEIENLECREESIAVIKIFTFT